MKKMILFALSFLTFASQAQAFMNIYISQRTIYLNQSCHFQLSEVDSRYAIEWKYSLDNDVNSIKSLPEKAFAKCSTDKCTVYAKDFKKDIPYFFSARQFIDANNNGRYDDGEFTRDWSNPVPTVDGADFNNRCTF